MQSAAIIHIEDHTSQLGLYDSSLESIRKVTSENGKLVLKMSVIIKLGIS